MTMMSCAWLWLYVGLFLMLAELLAPGFVIFFFGLAAITVGGLRFVFGEVFTLAIQLAAFSGFAILYLLFLRRYMKKAFSGVEEVAKTDFNNEAVGRVGKVTEAIEPPKSGRVLIGDAEWTATANAPIATGTDVKIVAQSNLTMRVAPL